MQIFAQEKYTIAVSPTKLNVLYVGVDNPLNIAVAGVNAEDIIVTISQGTIVKTDTNYIARVTKQGTAEIKIFKNTELLGTQNFRVKIIPDPIITVGENNLTGGYILKEKLMACEKLNTINNTDFDANFIITKFNKEFRKFNTSRTNRY